MTYDIKQVTGEDLLVRYNELRGKIDIALKHSNGEWTAMQLVSNAITDPSTFHVWEVFTGGESSAIATTRFIEYPNFNSIHITTLGGSGDYSEWAKEFEKIIKEHEHIDYLEFTGRRGLVKGLEKVGWTERYTTMRKHLKEN